MKIKIIRDQESFYKLDIKTKKKLDIWSLFISYQVFKLPTIIKVGI
jgi:hypothetical protein